MLCKLQNQFSTTKISSFPIHQKFFFLIYNLHIQLNNLLCMQLIQYLPNVHMVINK